MEFQDITYTKEEGIATITLNRPRTMNAFTLTMLKEWVAAIQAAKQDDNVKVVVVTGAGRAFCAGGNPREIHHTRMGEAEEPAHFPLIDRKRFVYQGPHGLARALADFDKPYIGSINGPAVGGGMDFASMCDIRIASDQAKFAMAYVRMGTIPAGGGCYFLPRIVGTAKACELIWTGRMMDASEALQIGYVSKVVPHDDLPAAARELATQIAKGPAVAIQLAKRLIYRCLELDLNTALEITESAQLIASSTEDAIEGPRAWVEKREPTFKGR